MSTNPEGLKKFSLLHVLIIATLAIGLYLNTLRNSFVYDDEFTIVSNTLVKSFDNLPLLFDKAAYFSHSGETSYRPVVTFTYFVDYAIYELKPWGYHLTNVLLHTINGALLYLFLALLLTPRDLRLTSPVFLISILFVSHPVLTEAVNSISYREDLLAFLFYMTTLNLYLTLREPATGSRPLTTFFLFLLSCLTYLFALLSKEMAVTLPLIIFCYEWFYGKEDLKLLARLFTRDIIGYIAITIFYLYLRFISYNPEELIGTWSLGERFLTLPWLIMNYLKLSLFPLHLSADYVINPMTSPFSLIFIGTLIALVFVFTIILIMGNREKKVLFGALFFLITLAPVYNLVPLDNPIAERYLYLPLVGFIMSAVHIAYSITEKVKIRHTFEKRYIPIFFLAVLVVVSFSVVKRNAIWRDDYSLWSDTVAKMPTSSRAHNNLGRAYYSRGRIDEAIRGYRTAIKLRFDYALAHNNLGAAYHKMGQLNDAILEYNTALQFDPNNAIIYNNIGNIYYYEKDQKIEALQEYMIAIKLMPDYLDPHNNIGNVYSDLDMLTEAIQEYNIALKLEPSNVMAHYRLANVFARKGLIAEARKELEIVLTLAPSFIEARKALESLN